MDRTPILKLMKSKNIGSDFGHYNHGIFEAFYSDAGVMFITLNGERFSIAVIIYISAI